tara:strand:+ start:580 stop:936 length:357 start_codon:yes stop_codon:yes gene_type:complete
VILEWDDEMFEMQQKLFDFIENNYIMYDYKLCDYVAYPKSDGIPEGYEKWKERARKEASYNSYVKIQQNGREWRKKNRKPRQVKELTCPHCGYYIKSAYYGVYYLHHGDKCKHKKDDT